uniref:Uncharacterized protein n=1 Tax=Hubei narna-like virus 10 TaxID=1922940 RepID=A0A1L3KIR3_9VIRU|nr:hypothetical protein [Hubei narna-like virus 10]
MTTREIRELLRHAKDHRHELYALNEMTIFPYVRVRVHLPVPEDSEVVMLKRRYNNVSTFQPSTVVRDQIQFCHQVLRKTPDGFKPSTVLTCTLNQSASRPFARQSLKTDSLTRTIKKEIIQDLPLIVPGLLKDEEEELPIRATSGTQVPSDSSSEGDDWEDLEFDPIETVLPGTLTSSVPIRKEKVDKTLMLGLLRSQSLTLQHSGSPSSVKMEQRSKGFETQSWSKKRTRKFQ